MLQGTRAAEAARVVPAPALAVPAAVEAVEV